ncbi:helix-hairpin-helix domain-containing protein [Fimbriimonas ginsengisoli]|uniref:Late competence protein ComEA, DNA receptor n=1 Tax=Fimbriimonas ginsengisoli Gsoil 348 TaxID=661478 RepID=A0A068NMF3_FIMGI|nr:helix-hairpin-helix domain-containing protein [Fimbriimonas ginsengisoli]AIE84636.1 Late competence protein ComEA, DNA receptor [Fimbriimonas ginsengisoli Gsoil 348]
MFQHRSPREQYAVIGIGVLLLAGAGYVGAERLRQPGPLIIQPAAVPPAAKEKPAEPVAAAPTELVVHVSGAVKSPGVVRLKSDSRVDDAVKAAGGPKANADLDRINLAAHLIDATVVYVPPKGDKAREVAPTYRGGKDATPLYTPEKAPQAPPPKSLAGSLPSTIEPVAPPDLKVESTGQHRTKAKTPTGAVSLNSATAEELQTLPGIGPSTAQKIIDYRQQHGPFASVDGLIDVKGIGPKKMEKLRQWLKL